MTSAVSAVILIDKRVFNYQVIAESIKDDVRYIVYDVDNREYATMIDYVKAKIGELNVSAFFTIGIVEYNTNREYYRIFGDSSPDALVSFVMSSDPTLESWNYISDFIAWLKTTYSVQYFDFLACSLYISNDWKYIIDTLSSTTGVQIRASTDKTGSSALGGDWILESTGTNVDLRDVYFTNAIENFDGVLDVTASITNLIPDPTDPNTPTMPYNGTGIGEFVGPRTCKIYYGNIYVADEQNSRYQVFDLSLNYISQLRNVYNSVDQGIADFAINTTTGVKYFASHTILMAYDSNNTFLFRKSGGELAFPRAITLDSTGNIYISFGYQIKKYDSSGNLLGDFINSSGSGDGQFIDATAITFDSAGNFWACDSGTLSGTGNAPSLTNHRVQKFTSTGTFLMKFGGGGYNNGQFRRPSGIAFDSSGNSYVTDYYNNRVQKFNSSGTFLTTYGSVGIGNGQFSGPMGIAVDTNGNIYVAENLNARVQKFNSSGTYVTKAGAISNTSSSLAGAFNTPVDVQMFPSNRNFYVVDSGNHRIQKFNSSNAFILTFGSLGTGDSQFNTPQRLAIDASENIYVADTNNHYVKIFNSSGTFLRKVGTGTSGSSTGQFNSPRGVGVDTSFNLYVTDNNARIQKFDSSGTFVTSYAIAENAWGLALDTNRNIYVTGANTVYKYSSSGALLFTLINSSVGNSVRGISVDPVTNNFVVSNVQLSPFLKIFDSTGTRLLASDATTPTSTGGYISLNSAMGVYYYDSTIFMTYDGFGTIGHSIKKVLVTISLLTSTFSSSTFTVASTKTIGDASFAIITRPTSDSSGAITYSSNNTAVATIDTSGNRITLVGAGTATFTAYQASTSVHYASTKTSNTLTVALGTSTFSASTFSIASSKTYGDASFAITTRPSSNSSGAVTYSSNNTSVATIDASGNWITLVGAGDVSFNATQAETSLYASASKASNTLTVALGTPNISSSTFTVASTKTYGDASFAITTRPTSNSAGAITYTSNNTSVATIDPSGNWITLVGSGDVSFNASQAAVPNQFISASKSSNTLTVGLATPNISASTFTVASSKTYGDSLFAITTRPTSDSSGAITYSSNNTSVATIDASGNWITLVGAGDVTFTATQAAVPNKYTSATKTSNTLTVSKATPSLTFANSTATKNVTDAAFTVTASSASLGAVTYASGNTSLATVNSNTGLVTLKNVGTVTITASQAETGLYNAPANATVTITITAAGSALAGQTVSPSTSFSGVDLSGASFSGSTLSGVSFSGANLSNVNFSGSVITGTNFTNANISGATNLPTFSTTQKLQLLSNINNAAIGAIQISTPLTGADINALLSSPVTELASATFTLKVPSTLDASSNKVVTVTVDDVSNNTSVYIPINANESVKINGVVFTFDGTNVRDASNNVRRFLNILGIPFKVYAGSIIGLNVLPALNSITVTSEKTGLYDVISELFTLKP